MGKLFDMINAELERNNTEARTKREAALADLDGSFNNADFKQVTEKQLDEFMHGKTILAVQAMDAPYIDGYIMWLDQCGTGLYIVVIENVEDDDQLLVKASIATVTEG